MSQEVQAVFGRGAIYFIVQLATMLILYTGGNTSFNGFPFLANFVAEDHFLPRQLTRRGHRLAFSNGILVLAAVSVALVLAYRAQVDGLVALYAIGVFTGFTMAGAGMVKHHTTQKGAHWQRSVVVNGFSAFLSALVVLIFVVAKFKEGAWLIVVVAPNIGTGGTLMGNARRLKEALGDSVKIVAAEPMQGEPVQGLRSLEDGFIPPIIDLALLDRKIFVTNSDAIIWTRKLLDEEGLFAGVSSGAIARVAVRIAGELDEGNVVFIVADDGWKYLSSGIYTRPLDEIENLESTLWW